MKVLAGLVVALLLGVGLVYWMGRRLPAEHTAVASGMVHASQDRVWELITDTASQSVWRTGLQGVSLPINDEDEVMNNRQCWVEWHRLMKMPLCLVEQEPESRRVVKVAGGWTRSFRGSWTFELQPRGDGATMVTITEHGLVKQPIWRFAGQYVMGERTNVKQYVEDLQREAVRKR